MANPKGFMGQRLYEFDRQRRPPSGLMAGVDEAGRGPLAGPVVAAAVMFHPDTPELPVNDSKVLTARVRQELFYQIIRLSFVGIGFSDENTIDRINIYQATRAAMRQAVLSLPRTPDLVLIDGNMTLDLPLEQRAIVKGDARSAAIAAASIVAKVFRDAWMERLDETYPGYAFKTHKGYATPAHLERIREIGPSPIHRRSFSPVRDYFQKSLL